MSRLLVYFEDGTIKVLDEPREIVLHEYHVDITLQEAPAVMTLVRRVIVKLEVLP